MGLSTAHESEPSKVSKNQTVKYRTKIQHVFKPDKMYQLPVQQCVTSSYPSQRKFIGVIPQLNLSVVTTGVSGGPSVQTTWYRVYEKWNTGNAQILSIIRAGTSFGMCSPLVDELLASMLSTQSISARWNVYKGVSPHIQQQTWYCQF